MNNWFTDWLTGIDRNTAISVASMVPGPIGAVAGTAEGVQEMRGGHPLLGAATIGLSLAGLGALRKAGKAAKLAREVAPALKIGPAPAASVSKLAQLADDAESMVATGAETLAKHKKLLQPQLTHEMDLAGQKIAKYSTPGGGWVHATYSMRPDQKLELFNIGSTGGDNSVGMTATRGILKDLLARNQASGLVANRIAGANPFRIIDKSLTK